MDITIIAGVVFFVVFYGLDYLSNKHLGNDFLSTFPLIIYFMFVYANVDETIAPFYLMMAIVILFFTVAKFGISKLKIENSSKMSVINGLNKGDKFTIRGPYFYLFNMALGIGIFLLMRLLLAAQPQNNLQAFLGVPMLSIVALKANLSIVTVMTLGVIENRFIVVLKSFFDLIKNILSKLAHSLVILIFGWIPFLNTIIIPIAMFLGAAFSLIGPIVLAALTFALFHLAAFNLVFGALFFAWAIMIVWLVIYQMTGNDIVMNVAHMLWNGMIQLIRIGGG